MTKVIVQIPCFNEEQSLGITLAALPRQMPGVDQVEWLVIDDGSTDRTLEVAREFGVDHTVRLPRHQGLARAFMAGLEGAVKAGADIIVNTDADNQYCADDIPKLIEPILAGRADMVVGERPIGETEHFSTAKKVLLRLGSWVVGVVSNTKIPDAPSGFRAISRDAALRLNVLNNYTYTLETIIQAGQKGMAITSVPIRTNSYLRPSRLVKSTASYVLRSVMAIWRIFMLYKPLQAFTILGAVPFSVGFLLGIRWLVLFFLGTPSAHVPILVLAAILMLMGIQLWIFGLAADLLAANRKILEEIQLRVRRAELNLREDKSSPSD